MKLKTFKISTAITSHTLGDNVSDGIFIQGLSSEFTGT